MSALALTPTFAATADALLDRLYFRDPSTGEHCERVAELAMELSLCIGGSEELAAEVYWAGKLHDVGKIALPGSILRNTGSLSNHQWELMHSHPAIGATIVAQREELACLAPAIRSHHERFDGSGYPDGLRGREIPLAARIIAVADSFDAMTSDRTYRPAVSVERARERMRECAGTQFDTDVVIGLIRFLSGEHRPLDYPETTRPVVEDPPALPAIAVGAEPLVAARGVGR